MKSKRFRSEALLLFILFVPCMLSAKGEKPLTKTQADALKTQLVGEWKAATKAATAEVYNTQTAFSDSLKMPLWWTTYGEKPADGYSLYISLHGGGTAPKSVNDQQWDNQKRLYRPKNCVYVAPRAPWDQWNMWCRTGIDELYSQLIRMCVSWLDVNPDKVYIMGYSAGGDGVWRMAPRMADTWAAASMMAGHPGDVSMLNLRNTPYMIWCGALDAAYDRNKLDAERGVQLDSLQNADPGGYIHKTVIAEGMGHWMNRIDTVAVDWMAQYQRNPYPKTIVWQQEEIRKPFFYWIEAPANQLYRGKTVRLGVSGNTIDITQCDYPSLTLYLNDDIVDLDQKVVVRYNGKNLFRGKLKRSSTLMRETLTQRNDPSYVFPAKVKISLK